MNGFGKFVLINGETIAIPDGITNLGELVVKGIIEKTNYVKDNEELFEEKSYFDLIEEIYLPASIQVIEDGTFSHCENLKNVFIEDNSYLMKLGHYAFVECFNLKKIELNKCVYLLYIGDCCFEETGIEMIEFYNSDDLQIGMAAFYNCSDLLSVKGLTTSIIPNRCFDKCESLVKFSITRSKNNILVVCQNAFMNCKVLSKVDLPNIDIKIYNGNIELEKVLDN